MKKLAMILAVVLGVAIFWSLGRVIYAKLWFAQAKQNAGSIHIVTMSTGGWPGDLKARGVIKTIADFAEVLVRNGALKANDLRVFAGPGFKPYKGKLDASGHLDPPFTDENCAYRIYLVRDSDPANTIFLQSKLVKGKGIVVARKGGDVSMYNKPQVDSASGGTLENCLNP
jgi:hypothetical protein